MSPYMTRLNIGQKGTQEVLERSKLGMRGRKDGACAQGLRMLCQAQENPLAHHSQRRRPSLEICQHSHNVSFERTETHLPLQGKYASGKQSHGCSQSVKDSSQTPAPTRELSLRSEPVGSSCCAPGKGCPHPGSGISAKVQAYGVSCLARQLQPGSWLPPPCSPTPVLVWDMSTTPPSPPRSVVNQFKNLRQAF